MMPSLVGGSAPGCARFARLRVFERLGRGRGVVRLSVAPHLGHMDEFPRRRHRTHRHLDQGWAVPAGKSAPERRAKAVRVSCAFGCRTETFGKANEIRIGEVASDQPIAVLQLLDLPYIAKRAVGENHRDKRDAMANGGCKLVRREHEAAVAADRHDRDIGAAVLRPERGGEAPTKIVLVARRQERARLVDGKGKARGKADLRHLINNIPSSGNSARIASRKARWGASLASRRSQRAWRSPISSRREV